MHLQQKRSAQTLNSRKKRGLDKKKRPAEKQQGTVDTPTKNNDKEMDMNLSIISDDDDFKCYNKAEERPVHSNIDDELQLLPKENNLTPEQGIIIEKPKTLEPTRKFKRLPFAKQTEKLSGIPYQTNNNKKKTVNNRNTIQEKTTRTTDQSEKKNDYIREQRRNPYNTVQRTEQTNFYRTTPEGGT